MRALRLLLLLLVSLWGVPIVGPVVCGAQTTLTIQAAQNLPDVAAGVASSGFTCTGICQHSDGVTWWVANYGFTDSTDVSLNGSSLVHLSADFKDNLGEISLSAHGSASIQGLCRQGTTLWFSTGTQLRACTEAGSLLSGSTYHIDPTGGCNGCCYDSVNDIFYVLRTAGTFTSFNGTTYAKIADLTSMPTTFSGGTPNTGPDHITMVGTKVWCAAGLNGVNGSVWEYDPANNAAGWSHLYTLSGGNAEEGIIVVGGNMYLGNDGLFHAPSPDNVTPALNRILTYQIYATPAIFNPNRMGRRRR